jgi:hypothetical protein
MAQKGTSRAARGAFLRIRRIHVELARKTVQNIIGGGIKEKGAARKGGELAPPIQPGLASVYKEVNRD